ncbi:hypothetical protein [Senegalia massiliensis]|uniref:Uncharacterized protein n=1 Tax=Senegalia massiliensis TaxID=1720316 RepID=A0A845QZ57_9CLOT|nr:hypothetical protein [Senegalia massiliensis]NBI08237.1 hypothetical protein [Senegalia massiliensis]
MDVKNETNINEEAMKNFKEVMEKIKELVKMVFNNIKKLFKNNPRVIDFFIGNKKEKQKFKPVLNIYPKKNFILDKRAQNYYCRSNC